MVKSEAKMPTPQEDVANQVVDVIVTSDDTFSKDPVDNAIIKKTVEKEIEKDPKLQKIGLVLTGGIDSTVLLYHVREMKPHAEIHPITIGDTADNKAIKHHLDELGIKKSIKNFPTKSKKIIDYCEKEGINPLFFAYNNDELIS